MWFLKEFKTSEIYVLLLLILYMLSILTQIIYTIPCICNSFETCSKNMNYMLNVTPTPPSNYYSKPWFALWINNMYNPNLNLFIKILNFKIKNQNFDKNAFTTWFWFKIQLWPDVNTQFQFLARYQFWF
jgi:hypothetical protein